ncbi:MAG TPA: serine protease [Acidimicrobiales bacterium]
MLDASVTRRGPSLPLRLLVAVAAFAMLQFGLAARAGAVEPEVVGGDPAEAGEYGWQVALVSHGSPPRFGQYCGGSLIAADVVLTAAHCVVGSRPADVDVFAGQHDLRQAGELIRAKTITVHPNYNSRRSTFDVAVIHLMTPSTQGTPGRLIRPTQTSLWEPGDLAWVTGWGATSEGGSGSPVLLEAQVPIVSDADCADAYGTDLVPEHHLCAGFLGQGGVDTCQGDSGGPMMVPNARGKLFIVGLTSWGFGCARPNFPGVYSEVATYLTWIHQQLG